MIIKETIHGKKSNGLRGTFCVKLSNVDSPTFKAIVAALASFGMVFSKIGHARKGDEPAWVASLDGLSAEQLYQVRKVVNDYK